MGLEQGLPWRFVLRSVYQEMEQDPSLWHVTLDEAMEQVYFTVRGTAGLERRYKLTIEHGEPCVEQVEGPAE
jgi:hypothetical protein